jgi:hypothetical protein
LNADSFFFSKSIHTCCSLFRVCVAHASAVCAAASLRPLRCSGGPWRWPCWPPGRFLGVLLRALEQKQLCNASRVSLAHLRFRSSSPPMAPFHPYSWRSKSSPKTKQSPVMVGSPSSSSLFFVVSPQLHFLDPPSLCLILLLLLLLFLLPLPPLTFFHILLLLSSLPSLNFFFIYFFFFLLFSFPFAAGFHQGREEQGVLQAVPGQVPP